VRALSLCGTLCELASLTRRLPTLRRSTLTDAGLRRKIWTMDLMSRKCLRLLTPRPVRHGGHGRLRLKQEIGAPAQGCRSTPAARYVSHPASVCKSRSQIQLAGRTRGSRAHRNVTSFTCSLSWKSDVGGDVPGPQAGNSGNRRPGTHSQDLQGTPSSSQETCASPRYVSERVVSVYLPRGTHDTQHLSSCLVTPASKTQRFPGRLSGGH
jgi:hypothetical protein